MRTSAGNSSSSLTLIISPGLSEAQLRNSKPFELDLFDVTNFYICLSLSFQQACLIFRSLINQMIPYTMMLIRRRIREKQGVNSISSSTQKWKIRKITAKTLSKFANVSAKKYHSPLKPYLNIKEIRSYIIFMVPNDVRLIANQLFSL